MNPFVWLARLGLAGSRARSSIADLMAQEPAAWECGRHYATHGATGLKVWIASGPTYLRVELPDGLAGVSGDREWTPFWRERRLIWQAYRRHLRPRRQTLARTIERLIQRHLDAGEERP